MYQILLSPLMNPCCRYHPTCSVYCIEAIMQLGVFKGLWRSCCRILRCHPYGAAGYDPVIPEKETY